MAHSSSSIPQSAWAVVLVITVVSAIAAATAPPPTPAPPSMGMPGCDTRCGDISVPYPFGMGSSQCYHSPGFNLTCDRKTKRPRLLLGDGTFQVVETIQSKFPGVIVTPTSGGVIDMDPDGNGAFRFRGGIFGPGSPYALSSDNELILIGCNVRATLMNALNNATISSCSAVCEEGDQATDTWGSSSYCRSPIITSKTGSAYHVHLSWFNANTKDDKRWPTWVLVATSGWFDLNMLTYNQMQKDYPYKDDIPAPPVWLSWEVPTGQAAKNMSIATWSTKADECSEYEKHNVCKSNHSTCYMFPVRRCDCQAGYTGNPYITDGCRDINECNQPQDINCYGNCTNTDGSFECHCLSGTHGNPSLPGGCTSSFYLPGTRCNSTCGDVVVPYPFGMGPEGCYSPGFNLTCDYGHPQPRLLLDDYGTMRVVNISLEDTTVHVVRTGVLISVNASGVVEASAAPILSDYFFFQGVFTGRFETVPYSMSTRNELILIGCNVQAILEGQLATYLSGCSSLCTNDQTYYAAALSGGGRNFYGMGCCQARISRSKAGMQIFLKFLWMDPNSAKEVPINVLVAKEGWFDKRKVSNKLRQRQSTRSSLEFPIILDWEILHSPRHPSTNICPPKVAKGICKSKNSRCVPGIRGYTCQCLDGYHGNPYTVADGCKGLVVLIGPASGAGLILLVLLALFISKILKHRRRQMLKRMFFEKNRGKLLKQLVSQRADISERMIISLEELEKATNNFDKARELGGGGHGTVYKGILSDLHVVAIKKPKKVVQEEIEEFINEVAILSQINHRNVVKLYGCCLETEVPMLVYEFISNGTLHDHLHVGEAKSLAWDDRQRIAIETAKSIAHLHSTTSIPIIHRDIKSVNILLDDTLTAKVADFGASRYVPIDKSGLTTRVQGTIGYMDPMYFYTGRLTEKSDVFGFGVMLVELLTRQKPFLYISSEGDGLVAHFSTLFAEGKLLEILDPQVMEEGGKEVEEVASLAVTCIKLAPMERPTMRQIELVLESIQSSKKLRNLTAPKSEEAGTSTNCSWFKDKGTSKECTRQYSMEEEFENSARYPR